MTREEAIHILDNLKPTNTKSSFDAYVVGKAITMAIQALQAQADGEYISRNNAITSVCQWGTTLERTGTYTITVAEMKQTITDMLCEMPTVAIPTVEPYKGMTNGQVHDMLYQMLVELKDGEDGYGAERWWNSPYKGVAIPSAEPCDDAISRQAVDEIKELMTDINGDTVYAVRMSDIRQLPSVKPQEPKTGHWIENLCDSCTNHACKFQSGILRSKCDFYIAPMPHLEPDNCGNYIVQQEPRTEALERFI